MPYGQFNRMGPPPGVMPMPGMRAPPPPGLGMPAPGLPSSGPPSSFPVPQRPDEKMNLAGVPQGGLAGAAPPYLPTPEDVVNTVFVGAIADGVEDIWLERILKCCGTLKGWRRVTDAHGKPKSFGFGIFDSIEAVYRAVRVIGGQGPGAMAEGITLSGGRKGGTREEAEGKLELSIDASVKPRMKELAAGKESVEEDAEKETREKILAIISDMFLSDMAPKPSRPNSPSPSSVPGKDDLDDLPADMPPEQRAIVSREIAIFRERSAAKDREKRAREEEALRRRAREEEATVARERERERVRREGIGNGFGRTPSAGDLNGAPGGGGVEEEDAEARRQRRLKDVSDSYLSKLGRWEQEESRIEDELAEWNLKFKSIDDRLDDTESYWSAKLDAYDEEAEIEKGNEEFYRDRHRWWSTRRRARQRELEDAAAEREKEAAEAEKARLAQPTAPDEPAVPAAVVGRIMTVEERNAAIQKLIIAIPADREKLFGWTVKWDFVNEKLIETRLREFIMKQITEHLGFEEKDLVDFVVGIVRGHASAEKVLEELQGALGEESEVFVMKLWRRIVYETEVRAKGLG
ncbi:hypothetical protein BDK51DRAFT_48692 [Blyttiomyces helicus]|uniref:PWI domain-containing protein n=1 Tax=Blyttiomyces helicus TaxID=388810 RepID=A0A4P9VXU2_9FUNG|nr:hypothetical protein BDK51DRAFT_48692 [Blyttiomyces helicus]|eukprot:RKO84549.1 hypothetical protein BDK51DRAFT_48692 [Blyttiomyces helicus]